MSASVEASIDEIDSILAEYAKSYPPLITLDQAAAIAHTTKDTIYAWSSAGRLDEFKSRRGRRVLLRRDAFVRYVDSKG